MTQEEKELLLKDLCARQPYNVMIDTPLFEKPTLLKGIADNMCWAVVDEDNYEWVDIDDIKPYLRPLYSMSKEEGIQYGGFFTEYEGGVEEEYIPEFMDFVYSHHLDIGHLIEKGLALEAPDGMYIIKQN